MIDTKVRQNCWVSIHGLSGNEYQRKWEKPRMPEGKSKARVDLGWMNWQQYSSYKELLLSGASNRKAVYLSSCVGSHKHPEPWDPVWWSFAFLGYGSHSYGQVPSDRYLWREEGRWCHGKLGMPTSLVWSMVHMFLVCQLQLTFTT